MKNCLTGVLAVVIAAASLPVTALAADNSDPVTKNGERLKYNTPYYVKDKNLSGKGGVTFEPWGFLGDFVLFADSVMDNGTSIIFEHRDGKDGCIESTDEIRIKFTNATKPGMNYWAYDPLLNSIYLNYSNRADHVIYGSSEDNSIGIGMFRNVLDLSNLNWMKCFFDEYKGKNEEKAWIESINYRYVYDRGNGRFRLPLDDKQTPFEVMEASE
ncbi:hypothetical protein [Bacillus sp. SRB3LM]|uniref:hypothetical protein n=1 Tax=Bacillus sp. SRB3LM TaxID=2608689 RepID=UPI0018C36224|nr:hypothetical protein [Bacillus sp. SRB3LM]MBG0969239.1 hypothetical protein [Bacillus sp. SRB3LM]MBG0971986.1 hypothetical protein [Bacillus sp. SRB3LM]